MQKQNNDQVFFRQFGMVMGALFVIFFICIAAAGWVSGDDGELDAEAKARIEARIAPQGKVITDTNVLVQMAAANKVARAAYTGEQVMQKVCAACHGSGLLNAPKTGDKAAWAARLSANGGLAGLVTSAIKGKGSMPARGGDADLSDDEVKAAVELMIK